jgi:putative signal transducing protein
VTDKLVAIAAFASQPTAALTKALLEQHGIRSVFVDAEMGALTILLGTDEVGGIKIAVPDSQVEQARRLLAKLQASSERISTSSTSEVQPDSCLRCGESMAGAEAKCRRCGWTFEART